MKEPDFSKYLKYISKYWDKITFLKKIDKGIQLGLPNKYVSPNNKIFAGDQFYWDSYFTMLGLIEAGKVSLCKGIVENFAYLFKMFEIMPMRNRFYNLGISQPPFYSSMVRQVYSKTNDLTWLIKHMKISEEELLNYWMDRGDNLKAGKHLIFKGLSRYADSFLTHQTAESESGWDMTSRFNDECLNILPVDLNSLLYKYEKDLEWFYDLIKNPKKKKYYAGAAKKRIKTMNELMWDKTKGFFFDYNYITKKKTGFYSLAGFFPMWAGMATKEQAKKLANNLKIFEYKGGLATTQKNNLSKEFRQWDYPNGWPPLQWIVIKGLKDYGFKKDAKRLANKWVQMNIKVFDKTGAMQEKYDVVKCDIGKTGRYPHQEGFGWTNAVFLKLLNQTEQ